MKAKELIVKLKNLKNMATFDESIKELLYECKVFGIEVVFTDTIASIFLIGTGKSTSTKTVFISKRSNPVELYETLRKAVDDYVQETRRNVAGKYEEYYDSLDVTANYDERLKEQKEKYKIS